MRCKKAERMILRSFDGLLSNEEETLIEKHLKSCPACQRKKEEYQGILDALKVKDFPEPKPYFWERLQPKLKEWRRFEPLSLWKQWALRAIPLSLIVVIILAASILLFFPQEKEELSPSEALLLHNTNPLQDTKTLLEEEDIENKNMMIIFTAMAEKSNIRRQFP